MKTFAIQNEYIKIVAVSTGAALQQVIVKDRNNSDVNVIIGYENVSDYKNNSIHLGATAGRFAGRIHKEGFVLNGRKYLLANNSKGVHLHGGEEGFGYKDWQLHQREEGENPFITFSYVSEAMEEGYPGELHAFCTYQLQGNKLIIRYKATATEDTIVNLTNHNYYNLAGKGSVLDHELKINAEEILEKDQYNVANGNFKPVANTYFDFRKPIRIEDHKDFKGLDDCYVITEKEPLATLYSEQSGIEMKISSNQPGVVVYTPEAMEESKMMNNPLEKYPSICFETQNFPDAPNNDHFPSAVLKKGEAYLNESSFEFAVK
ncbi:aldose epimerase family protein [Galbibacter mesophilus]|uniref:aldose epimerase family protein n=1 Tax=Galbibacter mesophilus TaxID=379069 RepID=UPI00191F1A74|nr:aldose epimerase family protein [Galbibacter mesophilus]MCM5661639.1 galactose mutarotase [Galbibacter mesophilus]